MIENLIIGGVAGVISRTVTAPLELYKIQCQNSYLKNSTFQNVIRKEGVRYLWKGNLTNCIRVFPQFALNYSFYEYFKQNYFNFIKDNELKHFYSGGVAGVGSMILVYPLETIRTRLSLQMNKSHYSNPFQVISKLTVYQLYRGVGMSTLGFGPFSAFNFMFYNFYHRKIVYHIKTDNYMNSTLTKLVSGGLAGMSSITITYPTDLLRRHFQMEGFNNQVPKYNGILDGFNTIIKKEGFGGLYKGIVPAYIRIFPCLALQFWCIENGKSFFDTTV